MFSNVFSDISICFVTSWVKKMGVENQGWLGGVVSQGWKPLISLCWWAEAKSSSNLDAVFTSIVNAKLLFV